MSNLGSLFKVLFELAMLYLNKQVLVTLRDGLQVILVELNQVYL